MEKRADQRTFNDYVFFWSGRMVSLLGSSIVQFVMVWWITLETRSTMFLSIASFLGFFPMVILGPVAGVLSDRWNRKSLIGVVDFLQASATVVVILLFWSNMISIWQVLALLGLRGIFLAIQSPNVAAVVPSMVPPEKLSRMNGLDFLFSGLANLVGPVVAAFLLEFLTIHQVLSVALVAFLVALVPLLLTAIPSVKRLGGAVETSSLRKEFSNGLEFIRSSRGFMALLITSIQLNFLYVPLQTLLPYYVRFDHSGNASDLALLTAAFQGGMLVGGLVMSVIRTFKKKMATVMLFMYVAFVAYGMVALMPKGGFWFGAIFLSIMGFSIPIYNVTLQTIIQTVVPLHLYGRVNSVYLGFANAGSSLGMILAGVLAQFIGTANLFLVCSLLAILVLAVSWLFTDFKHMEE